MDAESVWVVVEFAYGEPEVVMAGLSLDPVRQHYQNIDWRRAGDTWAASFPEGVGGMVPDADRVMIFKAPLVDA